MCNSLPAADLTYRSERGSLSPGQQPVPPTCHGHAVDRWSLRELITLPAEPASVPRARAHVRQCLRDWGFGRQIGLDACMVVTELTTNAVQASASLLAGAFVHVALGAGNNGGPSWLLVAVADASPKFPLLRANPEPDAIGGRGLRIVETLCTRWGWHPVRWPEDDPWLLKVVWAEWSL